MIILNCFSGSASLGLILIFEIYFGSFVGKYFPISLFAL
jgi:hypothetical protein